MSRIDRLLIDAGFIASFWYYRPAKMSEPLSYATPAPGPRNSGPIPPGWVKLITRGSAGEADMIAALLGSEGIEAQIFGARTSAVDWFWQLFNDVVVIVPEADAERANAILSRSSTDAWEPAIEPEGTPPPKDEDGHLLVPLAAFENTAEMRDAQVILASGHIDAYAPRLVLRGDNPAGVGKRFILRVADKDLQEARTMLAEEAEEDKDEPRCPHCGSWCTVSADGILNALAGMVGLGGPSQLECRTCHYRGNTSEFFRQV